MPDTRFLQAGAAVLVVIDVQEKMLAAISSSPPERIIDRIGRLIAAAEVLGMPVIWTEQYPKGLGPTESRLAARLAKHRGPLVKTTCSCWRDGPFRLALEETGREHVILCGLEAHVCVQQTALDLLRVDHDVFVAGDAVGSRAEVDARFAYERMACAGAAISSSESLIFELIERCDHPRFKDILQIVK